ncbi:DUF1145 domain-containing protein [Leptospira gomenensis]|uniref:DUF1145 domain-containing protein n=1 Tax=Leptospira gomenensis TaxID=2484974 RepID=A0A5F1Y949_9LEPT|nr:DUF1145 domain-containing protein [Leptospira gomenensis]TGK31023.1 DUF1145 domain-containing protein [Leptospira gomenensis]TGK43228.1 DUF1145 domain-containing protein [Leptospira gomenensis]TGK45257.1 DUF1145 domain-containing protein [Leptospira gomenensis]TGK66172.1 DUF1145 domain-containing protein [Leptospira gomenensis]
MNPIFQALKIGTVFFWIIVVANLAGAVSLGEPVDYLLRLVGIGTLTVHLFEIAYFWSVLKHKSARPYLDSLQIFVFGVFHLIPLKNR